MKLWLITQNHNTGYDFYDAAIVAAETDFDARNTAPSGDKTLISCAWAWVKDPSFVTARYIGDAAEGTKPGVILASFNAG